MFEARQPTALDLCEAYHLFYPSKILFLRPDTLALMLQMANISTQSRVLLVENTRGFMTGAVCEREVAYTLRVNFAQDGGTLKANNEIFL